MDRSSRFTIGTLAVVILLAVGTFASAQELLVFPKQNQGGPPWDAQPLREACLNPAQWPTGWNRATMFGSSYQYFEAWTNNTEIAQCFTNMRNANMKLVIELGVLKPHCQTAQACLNAALPTLSRIAGLGVPDVYLAVDEPITTGHPNYPNQNADFNYAVAQTVEFIRLTRVLAPGLKFMLHEAYPHLPITTIANFYAQVNQGAINATGQGVQYASLDWDWNDTLGGVQMAVFLDQIASLKSYVNSIGLPLSILHWRANASMTWEQALIHQGNLLRNAGIIPQMYGVLNFTNAPAQNLPESTPGTFMRALREFANVFLPRSTSAFGLASSEYLLPNQGKSSVDNRFRLLYQGDGNLVLYRTHDPNNPATWQWLWQTYTNGHPAGGALMQGADGKFVVYYYVGGNYVFSGWASNTSSAANAGAYLVVQSDGNVVIYRGLTPIWNRPNFVPGQY